MLLFLLIKVWRTITQQQYNDYFEITYNFFIWSLLNKNSNFKIFLNLVYLVEKIINQLKIINLI